MESKKMRSAQLPKDHWEKNASECMVANQKYASEFGNPAELLEKENKLAAYAKSHRAKN